MCNDLESQIKSLKNEQFQERAKWFNHDQKMAEKDVEIAKLAEMKKINGY